MKTADRSSVARRPRLRWLLLAWSSLWALLLYLGITLPFEALLPSFSSGYFVGPVLALSFVATYDFLRKWHASGVAGEVEARLQKVTLLSAVLLFCFLAADVGSSVYFNFRQETGKAPDILANRNTDPQTWNGELMPQEYYPSEGNFFLYKPRSTSGGYSYGELYYPALLQHRVLKESVLQLRQVEFSIDQYGLRNTHPPEQARIFALGDSFCFGYHMTQSAIWTELLQSRLGQPVYNLGVSGTSPFQQLLLLQYLIAEHPASFKPRHLLWMVFEGNDLEDSYGAKPPVRSRLSAFFDGTIVKLFAEEPAILRKESLIRSIFEGEISGKWPFDEQSNPYILDGVQLAYPLYHSSRLGDKLFQTSHISLATQPDSYVLEHPNRPRLEETFRRMRALSQEHGFDVTVVLVPTDARLYKDDFEGFPPFSTEPHFLNYVKQLCAEAGFEKVDLRELLAPYAKQELLYQRDDSHWNERGHDVVAKLLAENTHLKAQ